MLARESERSEQDVEGMWNGLKTCLLEVAENVSESSKVGQDITRLGGGMMKLQERLSRRESCTEPGRKRDLS